MSSTRYTRLLCSAAVIALASGTAAFAADADFNIQPQSLNTALNAFSEQSAHPVLFKSEMALSKTSGGVSGQADPEVALAQLLQGTGLSYRRAGDTFVIVEGGSDPQSGSAAGDGAEGTVEALIVTAQKREEDIQDVPIAISAFTQEDLTRSQVAGGPDLMTQVPNMTFTKTNFSSYSIQIRGIGTQAISATVDPAVAVAFNNTPFVRNRFFEQEFYDLQRVEVLRGPQGTLYGRNATAGVVNIISAKPKFNYEAKLSGDVSNYSSTRLEGMVNIPLVEDVVALRLASAWTKREGYVTNEITGNPIDGRDLWSTRVSLRIAPTDRFDANLIWEHFEEDDDRLRSGKQLCHKHIVTDIDGHAVSPDKRFDGAQKTFQQSQLSQGCIAASLYAPESFETPNGFQFGFYHPLSAIGLPVSPEMSGFNAKDPYVSAVQSRDLRVIESTVDPSYKAKSDVVEVQFTYDLTDTLSLTSETAWASDVLFSTQDYNRFNTRPGMWAETNARPNVLNDGVFCDPQVGCSDRLVLVDLIDSKAQQFSQELRLASDFDGPFNFSLGGNFLRGDSEDKYYVFINALTLWASADFSSRITTPYEPGVSENLECSNHGYREVSLDSFGTVSTAGNCIYIDPNPIGALNDLGHNYFLSKNPYKLISYAVFGEAYYQITDNLKATAGLRWTVDKKEAPRIPSWLITAGVGYPVLEVVEQEWREPTGRLTVDWKPDLPFTDETMVYASYAHGYKAGGANPPPAGVALNVEVGNGRPDPSDTHPLIFDAEFVDAFELGAKNTLFDGQVTLNATAFYYDYKDYQLSQIVDRSAITKNFDATVWGLEIEADWRPLENLRLGFKGGYENTRVADGESAVDIMDRSDGGRTGTLADGTEFTWIVVKPFPWFPSNCIMPSVLWTGGGAYTVFGQPAVQQVGNVAGSTNSGPCDMSYFQGLDIMTMQPYVANPPGGPFWFNGGTGGFYPDYPGFDPASAPNNGEGFSKDLGGNELPNAPHFTATITADYTIPLPSDWLMTLHTDLYYQSEAWTRIFNTEGYDKLKAYTNVNFAAIFTNEEAGWNVMAYVKNVFDRDSITGAFLNSDDSGLTTNVFLTEPRLYGLRVTKAWTGGSLLGTFGSRREGPYPFTVELGGQVQRHDAPYETVRPAIADFFSDTLDLNEAVQHRDLDWGDGREVKLTWRPNSGPWTVSAGMRYGKTNGGNGRLHAEEAGDTGCALGGFLAFLLCNPASPYYDSYAVVTAYNSSDATASNREEHEFADLRVGRDIGLGLLPGGETTIGLALRYADLESVTRAHMNGIPDWDLPVSGIVFGGQPATHHRYRETLIAERAFEGVGPVLSWDQSTPLLGDEEVGHLDLDWSVNGGVLFGKQQADITGTYSAAFFRGSYVNFGFPPIDLDEGPVEPIHRSESVTVPLVDVSLGLSYEVDRFKIGAGYRWERYFDAIDGGDDEAAQHDRTIDGPYFKLSVGFGGG